MASFISEFYNIIYFRRFDNLPSMFVKFKYVCEFNQVIMKKGKSFTKIKKVLFVDYCIEM